MEKLGQAANVAQLLGVDLKGLTSMVVWAVKTICRNGNECRQLAERADRLAVVLRKLQESEMGGRLEEEWKLLEEGVKDTLRRAYDLVAACQQGHGFSNHLRRFRLRNDLADRRRKVDDYLQQLRLFNQRITTDEQTRLLHDIRDRVVNQDGAQVSQELTTNHSDCNARMQFHETDRTRSPVGYVDPTRICKTQHTVQMRADCAELVDKTPEEKEEYIKKLHKTKKLEVATYLAIAMLAHADKNVLMVPYVLTDHYILFLVYPKDQLIISLDPAHYDKETFMEFLTILNLAHKYYRKRGGPVHDPAKKKLSVKTGWPCYKQPAGTNL